MLLGPSLNIKSIILKSFRKPFLSEKTCLYIMFSELEFFCFLCFLLNLNHFYIEFYKLFDNSDFISISVHSKIKFSMLDAKIDNSIAWQKNHWKSIQSAYNSSPFFEFYRDSLEGIYIKEYTYLTKFNFDLINLILEWTDIEMKSELSKSYKIQYKNGLDLRENIENKKYSSSENIIYKQVFSDKNGFLNDLSIIDLIFNEGPNSISYLK